MTKPINDKDEYDIDLVCELDISKLNVTQKQLKRMIGDRLKSNGNYARMLEREEGRRCWTLNYADQYHFHMDILPALPEDNEFKLLIQANGVDTVLANRALAITDKTHRFHNILNKDWPRSNPEGFAFWFNERMKVQFQAQRIQLAEMYKAHIEDVPAYRVKTTLQRAIQILKRHRDIMFQKNPDNKPISIIITTLAALAYNNEGDLLDALLNIVGKMTSYIEMLSTVPWIMNPVNPLENFADKWRENPLFEKNFNEWIMQVRNDINISLHKDDIHKAGDYLKLRLGERAMNEALRSFPEASSTNRSTIIKLASHSDHFFDVPHRQKPLWPIKPYNTVSIGARVLNNGQSYSFENDGADLPKGAELLFIADTDATKPFDVYWQVVNTGQEAISAKGLRGNIFEAKSAGVGGLPEHVNRFGTILQENLHNTSFC